MRRTDGGLGQLGGVLIVSPDGSVAFSYLSADASDVPSNADALLAARKACGRSRARRRLGVGPLGIALRRRRSSAPDTAAALADVVLRDHTGADVRLGGLWAERPALLAFLRHFG